MNLDQYKGCPQCAKEINPHAHGYPSYMDRAFERRQLDECIEVNDETVAYLYTEYTPTTTDYPRGSRPLLEMIVETVCGDCATDTEKAIALVEWRRANYRHIGKCGLGTEEEIILGGYSMCHDASRSLIALCQVAGMGARMVLGFHEGKADGHTLMEAYFGGKWALLDPSPCMPHPYYKLENGTFANGWDIKQDPTIPSRCTPQFTSGVLERVPGFFTNYRLVNYSLEESTRNMAMRFLRLITAQKIVENYDYTGHLNHQPPSAYTDLDEIVRQWVQGTLSPTPDVPTKGPEEQERVLVETATS